MAFYGSAEVRWSALLQMPDYQSLDALSATTRPVLLHTDAIRMT